jgi:SAM-dependent methyltransferase
MAVRRNSVSLLKRLYEKLRIRLRLVSANELTFASENLESRISAKNDTRLQELEKRLDGRLSELDGRLSELDGRLSELDGRLSDLHAYLQLLCRAAPLPALPGGGTESPDSDVEVLSYDQQLLALEALEPLAFPIWWECFEAGRREYERTYKNNLSAGDHPAANAFGEFVARYVSGRVLDIGCGPQLVPSYLRSTIAKGGAQVYGVEPLVSDHPFPCYRGFAEFLPWNSNTFDAVVCGTSLDHCLSLEKSLEEIRRVIRVGGTFLIWVGFISGAGEYDPRLPELVKLDEYHLFNFDKPWFEALLTKKFGYQIDIVSFDDRISHFYAFRIAE